MELLPRPAGRRGELRRLRGAVDLSAVPQDGRRANQAALQQALRHPRRLRLAQPGFKRRRRTGNPLPPHPGGAGQGERHAGRDLPQVAKQNPGPGQAAAADRHD